MCTFICLVLVSTRGIWPGYVNFCGTYPENNFHKDLFFCVFFFCVFFFFFSVCLFGSDLMESMCMVFGTG